MMAATPGPSCSSRRTAPAVPQGTRLLTRIARPLRGQPAAPGPVIPPDMLDFDADPALQSATVFETAARTTRSEEHTSELQSLMRISYAVFCLKKKHSYDTRALPISTNHDTKRITHT